MPDFNKMLVAEIYVSGFGLGVVLMQEGMPIAFNSQLLGPRAQSKSVYEKELMPVSYLY